jgi:hypothetical protein
MNKVYYVNISGRTLESRDLRELLARAVAQKRISDRKSILQNLSRGQAPVESMSNAFIASRQTVAL